MAFEKVWSGTAILGCDRMVLHPLMPYLRNDIGHEKENYEMNFEFMSRICEAAKKRGIIICLENMPFKNFSLSKPCDILRFVKAIDDDNFKICLDTGHVAVFEGISVKDSVVDCGSEIRAFHIHDNKFYEDWCFQRDGAAQICRLLFEEATDINFYVGRAINPAHQNPNLPINFNIKMNLVEELSACLKQMGKRIKVSYF